MYYKIAQLILTPGQKASSTSEVFVAQPDANKEALAGKLFALIEIESKKADDFKIINYLIDRLNHNYYQSEKLILRERIGSLKVEHIFESALAKTNKNLAEFLQTEKIKLDPKLINITIGVIYKNNLHFTNLGKNKALLIYKNKASGGQTKHKIIDIVAQTENDDSKKQISLTKLFTNVISGSIPRGGYFVFTNETLPEYLSNKQLIDIITTLPPASAVEQIKNILAKINAYVSFSGIIIKNTVGQQPAKSSKQIAPSQTLNIALERQTSTQASVDGLNITEETTEKLLTPTGVINFKKWFAFLKQLLAKIYFKPTKSIGSTQDNKIFLLKDRIFLKRKSSWLSVKKIIRSLKNIIFYFINFIIYFFKIITDKNKMAEIYNNSKLKLTEKIKHLKYLLLNTIARLTNWFKNLNKRNKVLFIVATVCLLLFVQNLFILSLKNKKEEYQKTYTNLVKLIEQKQNQVEASLLYSNEPKAKNLLEEIKKLLAQLPQDSDEQKHQFNQLTDKYEQQLEKIRHVIKIEHPNELANFVNLNSNAKPDNLIITMNAQGKIYVSDSEQKSIYSLDVADKLATAIADLKQPINKLNYPAIDKNNNIYYFNLENIIQLNTETGEIANLAINLVGSSQDVVNMTCFNNRLYLLDKKNNQIYRYNKSADSFPKAQVWLKEKEDFSNAVNMAIDGHIYVLKSNGELLKFLKGRKQEFKLEIIEPALEQPIKVIVSSELKYIYIFEPSKQRLVVFDKTGQFLLQYQSDQLTDLKDFTVDEVNRKIYFLNGTSVYQVEAVHFEE